MIKVEQITKSYRGLKIWENLTLDFPENKITALLGPSGCGKTTLLNVLAGLMAVDAGVVRTVPEISYVFQEPRLLPWLTVRENLRLVLRDQMAEGEADCRVTRYLNLVRLEHYGRFYPVQLSGGLRQRVALARAFMYPSTLLLMDEPFKSLDVKTRFGLMEDLLNLWRQEPRTVIAVTHDVDEAVRLGDKIIILTDKPARVLVEIVPEGPKENRSAAEVSGLETLLWAKLLE